MNDEETVRFALRMNCANQFGNFPKQSLETGTYSITLLNLDKPGVRGAVGSRAAGGGGGVVETPQLVTRIIISRLIMQ